MTKKYPRYGHKRLTGPSSPKNGCTIKFLPDIRVPGEHSFSKCYHGSNSHVVTGFQLQIQRSVLHFNYYLLCFKIQTPYPLLSSRPSCLPVFSSLFSYPLPSSTLPLQNCSIPSINYAFVGRIPAEFLVSCRFSLSFPQPHSRPLYN